MRPPAFRLPGEVMRACSFAWVVVILSLGAGSALGQSSLQNTLPTDPSWAPPPPFNANVAPITPAPATEQHGGPWSVDVLLGAPLGVRVQRTLGADSDGLFRIEAFAGTYFIFPEVAAGLRMNIPCFRGERNELVLSPGVDIYLLDDWLWWDGERTLSAVAADVEFTWRHTFENTLQSEVGLKLGAMTGAEHPGRGVLPIVALFGGFTF
jgi:hypothetical protein